MNDKHIEMRGVRKSYRFFTLDDLSLDLEPGQIMGFVGPNGAGKSTTLRLAMGFIAPDAGEIRVLGHAMPEAQAAAKRDIGYVSAEMRLLPHATLGWHMEFVKSIYPEWDGGYAATLVKRFNLRPEQNARSLSLGEQVKAHAAAGAGAPPAPADPRRADHRPRPGGAPRSDQRVHGRAARRQPLDPVLLAQHRRRGAHLGPHHVHRSRPYRRQQQQGRLPRPLAPHPRAVAAGRLASRAAEHREHA